MDELVVKAMARWPDVPAVYGWLRLDRRGRWLLVDRGRPGFDERLHGSGSEITSPQIVDFIGRNYECDETGRWYWQNGPQRVYVDVELAPLIVRVLGSGDAARLVTHTGRLVERIESVLADGNGNLLMLTDLGPAAVHDLDLASLALRFADDGAGETRVESVTIGSHEYPVRHLDDDSVLGFARRPRAAGDPTPPDAPLRTG
jgi:hypothetical protein